MTKRAVKPAYGEGRQALINAAITLVANKGLSSLTYRSLAAAAGITSGSLQHHFKSIDEVIEASLTYCIERSQASSADIRNLDDFIDVIQTLLREELEHQLFQVQIFAAARVRENLSMLVARHQAAYAEIIQSLLEVMQIDHDRQLINFISASVDGIVFQAVMLGPEQVLTTKEQFQTLKRVISAYSRIP